MQHYLALNGCGKSWRGKWLLLPLLPHLSMLIIMDVEKKEAANKIYILSIGVEDKTTLTPIFMPKF